MPTTNKPKLAPSRSSQEAKDLMCDPKKRVIAGYVVEGNIRGFPPLNNPRRIEPAASDKVIRVKKGN